MGVSFCLFPFTFKLGSGLGLGLWSAVAERSVDTAFETVRGVAPTGDIASA
jgi:hypothetical protein